MKAIIRCFLILFSCSGAVASVRALDASIDLAFSQSVVRNYVPTPDGVELVKLRSSQLSESFMISQALGDQWSLSGSFYSVQSFTTNLGLALLPQSLAFQAGVTFSPWEFLSLGAEYNASSVFFTLFNNLFAFTEHEPVLTVTGTPVFPVDWFTLSAGVSASWYYFDNKLASRRGWSFTANVMPQYSVHVWGLDIGLPVAVTYDTAGYRGATNAGFNNCTPGLSVTWTGWDTVSVNITAGYVFSLLADSVARTENSYSFFQLGLGFLFMGGSSEASFADIEEEDE